MAAPAHIATRRVLLIPGFDPNPPRAHRERYRSEGAKQAGISGYALSLRATPASGPGAWRVETQIDGKRTVAQIDVLVWSDLVRNAMSGGIAESYVQLLHTAWIYLRSGTLFRLMRLRKGPVIAALYPVVALVAQALLALLVGLAAAWLWARALGWLLGTLQSRDPAEVTVFGGLLVAAAAAYVVLRWFKRRDGVFLAHYLMQDYAFAAGKNGAYRAVLSDRLAVFSDRLAEAAEGPEDELLLVGHSSGAYLAVTVLADALRAGGIPEGKPVALLTLGHVIPMVSFLPGATRLRADLAYLAACDRITWVDISAPGDGCAFALCDPVAVSGVAPETKRWPLVLSAAFTQTLSPETWARLRWRFFRLHFQYLCAFDRPGDYDFFAITAGPHSLADRFAGRAPSGSRIEAAINRPKELAG